MSAWQAGVLFRCCRHGDDVAVLGSTAATEARQQLRPSRTLVLGAPSTAMSQPGWTNDRIRSTSPRSTTPCACLSLRIPLDVVAVCRLFASDCVKSSACRAEVAARRRRSLPQDCGALGVSRT
jgi:hypothetical protein